MEIKLDEQQEQFFDDLESNKPIQAVAGVNDWAITTDQYMLMGLAYMQHKGDRLGKRILDYLCECNFHSSHEALEDADGTDLYEYLKAY